MKKIIVSLIVIIIVIILFFVLKPNPEKKIIDNLIRSTVDSVLKRDAESINQSLTDDFVAMYQNYEICKEDFENKNTAKTYMKEIETIQIRNISISISDADATAKIKLRASSARLNQDLPWAVTAKLKKIDSKWLFDKAEIINIAERIRK